MDSDSLSASMVSGWQHDITRGGQTYRVRETSWQDEARLAAYQRLRATIFVADRGWSIPVTPDGREQDRWDQLEDPSSVRVFCAYGIDTSVPENDYLLAGLRIFELQSWDASMLTHEFRAAGMIDEAVLSRLRTRYPEARLSLLEATRFCVLRGARYQPAPSVIFDLSIARDLMYAAIFRVSAQTRRRYGICLVDSGYRQVLRRSAFCFEELAIHDPGSKTGYALIVIDFVATIHAIGQAKTAERATWLLCLCDEQERHWYRSRSSE